MNVDPGRITSILFILKHLTISFPEFGFLNELAILGAAEVTAISLEDFPALNNAWLNLLGRATAAIQVWRDLNYDLIGSILVLTGRKLALPADLDCRYDGDFTAFGGQIGQMRLRRVVHTVLDG